MSKIHATPRMPMAWTRLDFTLDPLEEIRCRTKFRPFIKNYGPQTKFSRKELEALLIIHYKLTKERPMDAKYFGRVMYNIFGFSNDMLIGRMFSAIDRKNRLVITPDSWLLGLSLFLRGQLEERIAFCFNVYDMMGDGFIKKEVMFQALKSTYSGASTGEDPEEALKELIELLLKKMDRDMDGKISFNDYKESVRETESLLEFLGFCLPSRPAVYNFMSTITHKLTTKHSIFYF